MNEPAFADAVRPMPCVVLRLRMLPYSIGHELLLRQANNPLLGDDAAFSKLPNVEQRTALINAVMVCCRPWIHRDKPHHWMRFWGWLIKYSNWALEIAEFRAYRILGSSFPRLLPCDEGSDSRVPGGDLLARLLPFVGFNFDCPLGMAYWLYFCHMESEGNCKIENETERTARKMADDILREKGIKCPL